MQQAQSARPKVTVTTHPDGFAHTRSTIATMCKLATEGSHTYEIRSLATRIVHGVPSKQVHAELQTLYRWVRDHIRYRFDPVGLEWVQTPARTVKEQAGDCDDMATLLAALAGSLGHKWRFLTVGPSPSVMKHVAVEVWDGREWVTLDPVLEPPGATTAPRSDVGMFGRSAPARARHTWSSEGTMLSGPVTSQGVALWDSKLGSMRLINVEPHAFASRFQKALATRRRKRRRKGLSGLGAMGGPVSTLERELWSWAAYYPSDPQHWVGAGIAPTPSPVYRSGNAPGFADARPIVISAPEGQLLEGLGHIDGLGFGFLKKIGKAVGGVVKGVAKVATSIPGVSTIAKLIPGASLALDAAKMVGNVLSPDKPSGGGAPAAAAPAALTAGGAPSPYAPQGSGAAPVRIPTNIAQRSDIDALRAEVRANSGFATRSDLNTLASKIDNRNSKDAQKKADAQRKAEAKARDKAVKAARDKERKAAKAAIAKLRKKNADAIAKLRKQVKAAKGKPCPAVGAKYPPGSRQTFDAKAGKYRVYAPRTAMAGLGFIKPTLSFTLGSFGIATVAQAAAAVAAVSDFIKKNKGQAPQVRLAAVKSMQAADGTLTADGLWGPNARVAAAWYLNKPASAMPPVAAPYAKGKVTWKPPAAAAKPPAKAVAVAAKPVAKPAPKPVPKPAAKPAPKPAPKPAAKPKPKPTPRPAPKPAAKKPAPVVPIRKPAATHYTPPAYAPQPDIKTRASTLPVPVSPKTAVAPIPKAPAGMVAAGVESANPGLPPVGVDATSQPSVWLDITGPTLVDPFEAPAVATAREKMPATMARGRKRRRQGDGVMTSERLLMLLGLGWYAMKGRRAA